MHRLWRGLDNANPWPHHTRRLKLGIPLLDRRPKAVQSRDLATGRRVAAAGSHDSFRTRRFAARARLGRVWRFAPLRALVGAVLISVLVIAVRQAGWLQPLELMVYDTLVELTASPAPSHRILLVGITESDIHRYQYPLADGTLAEMLRRIVGWHPRVVAVDIYRDKPVGAGADRLAALLKAHPEIYWVFGLETPGDAHHPGVAPPAAIAGTGRAVLDDVPTDPGGVARRGVLYEDDGKSSYTSLAMAVALGYLADDHIRPEGGPNGDLKLGAAVIPPLDAASGPYVKLDSRGYQVLLDYRGGADPFPRVTGGEVMDRDLSAMVRGRAVIVGGTEISVKDSFPTPFSTGFGGARPDYGIEIHARLASQLISEALGRTGLRHGLSRLGEDCWIAAWALAGAALGLLIRGTVVATAGGAAGLAVIGAVAYVAFDHRLLLPVVPAGLSWAGAAALTNQVLYAASNRARTRLRKSFEHYLPPVVIERMLSADSLPSLGGERREISVLFTDVAGFTTFSERMDPEDLAALANEYFDGVCHAVFAHGGLVNAFIGDSVLAFFGAPVEQPDHADRTVAAALDIDRFACRFIEDLAARGIEFGHTRIGLHTGLAFVGNIGTRERLQYTALGDMLNTGSRLEGLNKAIGTRIAVSGDIAAKATGHRFRRVGSFVVKGRSGATEVLTPIDPEDFRPEWERRYETAFCAAEAGRPEAADLFAALYRENPDDPCVAFHHRRLAAGETGTSIHMDEK